MLLAFSVYSISTLAVPLKPHILSPVPRNPPFGKSSSKPCHGMKATDSDFVFLIETVVGAIFNGSSVEQAFALHCEIKRRFFDLIRPPHGHRILCIHGKLDRFCERKVSADRYGTFILLWNNAAARAVKDAQMRIAEEIVRQPADRKRFKFPIPIFS